MANCARYTTQQVIDAIKDSKGIKSIVAARLGCTRQTIDNYIKRHPTVARAYQEERERIVDIAEAQLLGKLRAGEWPAIRYTLSTLGKNRGYTEKSELEFMGAIETRDVTFTDDQRAQIISALIDRARARDIGSDTE